MAKFEISHGDIFYSGLEIIINPVNCVGVMGAGLAKTFANKFPNMLLEYRQICKSGLLKVGENFHIYDVKKLDNNNGQADKELLAIINFPTKNHYKNPSKIEWIKDGLNKIIEAFDKIDVPVESIGIPALGCGYGGLPWEDVLPLIQDFATRIKARRVVAFPPKF